MGQNSTFLPSQYQLCSFLPETSFGLRVLSLPESVRVCPCMCVNPLLVRAITHHPLTLGSPNLDKRCKTTWLWPKWFLIAIVLTFKVKINLKSKSTPFSVIPCNKSTPIEARTKNLDKRCKTPWLRFPFIRGLIDVDLHGQI